MTRKKRNTWQPNEITSIIRCSQDSRTSIKSSVETSTCSHNSPRDGILEQPGDSGEIATEGTTTFESSDGDEPNKHGANFRCVRNLSSEPRMLSQATDSDNKNEGVQTQDRTTENTISNGMRTFTNMENSEVSVPSTHEKSRLLTTHNIHSAIDGRQEPIVTATTPSGRLRRTSSLVRLSTSLDGKASVVLKGNTPSPPSKQQHYGPVARSGLQRSKSMLCEGVKPATQDMKPILPVPRVHGRSRDARTWEFYCDSDVRESLTKTADHNQRGSAAASIQLIRTGPVGRQPLSLTANKSNGQIQRQGSLKRKSDCGQGKLKPKLARTTSSFGRLQRSGGEVLEKSDNAGKTTSTQPNPGKEQSGDSDKENWEPGTHRSHSRPKPSASRQLERLNRGILQEDTGVPSQCSSFEALLGRDTRQKGCSKKEIEDDDEISAFLTYAGTEHREDDFDAVQNLLSLSQGAWE